jgi:hypothetical protein
MKTNNINLAPVARIINSFEKPGETRLSLEQRLCVLDTAKQILLYQYTVQHEASRLKAMKKAVDECYGPR